MCFFKALYFLELREGSGKFFGADLKNWCIRSRIKAQGSGLFNPRSLRNKPTIQVYFKDEAVYLFSSPLMLNLTCTFRLCIKDG